MRQNGADMVDGGRRPPGRPIVAAVHRQVHCQVRRRSGLLNAGDRYATWCRSGPGGECGIGQPGSGFARSTPDIKGTPYAAVSAGRCKNSTAAVSPCISAYPDDTGGTRPLGMAHLTFQIQDRQAGARSRLCSLPTGPEGPASVLAAVSRTRRPKSFRASWWRRGRSLEGLYGALRAVDDLSFRSAWPRRGAGHRRAQRRGKDTRCSTRSRSYGSRIRARSISPQSDPGTKIYTRRAHGPCTASVPAARRRRYAARSRRFRTWPRAFAGARQGVASAAGMSPPAGAGAATVPAGARGDAYSLRALPSTTRNISMIASRAFDRILSVFRWMSRSAGSTRPRSTTRWCCSAARPEAALARIVCIEHS